MKETFLPFWVTTATVQVVLKGAQLGYDAWQSVYNPATRRFEQQLRTSWRQVRLRQTWERSYSASDEGMQVSSTPLPFNQYTLVPFPVQRARISPCILSPASTAPLSCMLAPKGMAHARSVHQAFHLSSHT